MTMEQDDLRAGVAAGIVTEEQAARLMTLAQSRAGLRDAMPADEEQFELFRGFSEIFISVGLVILMIGLGSIAGFSGGGIIAAIVTLILTFVFANYFTLKRRMALPSIVLTIAFTIAIFALFTEVWPTSSEQIGLAVAGAVAIIALVAWYYRFKIPFTMFLIGASALTVILTLTNTVSPTADWSEFTDIFNLAGGSGLAYGTLVFGILAFVVAMLFDMRDPHRLGRYSASAFWLHLLAAPALVNTIAMTFVEMGPGLGYFFLLLTLIVVSLLALIIDRRSFLTAGIAYFGFLLSLFVRGDSYFFDFGQYAWMFILLGGFVTLIGAYWTQARGAVLRVLPDFPGKHRLPPY